MLSQIILRAIAGLLPFVRMIKKIPKETGIVTWIAACSLTKWHTLSCRLLVLCVSQDGLGYVLPELPLAEKIDLMAARHSVGTNAN
jgi:hypothetical protein